MTGNGPGLCRCGCGEPTPIAEVTDRRRGWVRGEPRPFIPHHHLRGSTNPKWAGGRTESRGYILVRSPGHPRANRDGYVAEHILVVESVLGKLLPMSAVVHHADRTRTNNAKRNLVACQDQSYHRLLHQRLEALIACGHASWLKCRFCKVYDAPERMYVDANHNRGYHRSCAREYWHSRKAAA